MPCQVVDTKMRKRWQDSDAQTVFVPDINYCCIQAAINTEGPVGVQGTELTWVQTHSHTGQAPHHS